MALHRIAALVGGGVALLHFIVDIYHAFRVSRGLPIREALLPELMIAVLVGAVLIAPALLLWFTPVHRTPFFIGMGVFYAAVVVFGVGNVLLADDPLAAGLPMVLLVMPYCVVVSLILVLMRSRRIES